MANVRGVNAVEILDSRGNPTLAVTITLSDGTVARAGVPSGPPPARGRPSSCATATPPVSAARASLKAVGKRERRDRRGDLRARAFADLAELDQTLIELDGTENKSRLGANAIVGVSMAAARAHGHRQLACRSGVPSTRRCDPAAAGARTSTSSTAASTRRTSSTSRSS